VRIAAAGGAPGTDCIVDRDGKLLAWLAKRKATVLAVRPDGFVYAAGDDAHPLPAPPAGLTVRATRVKDHA
jgi:3-(3-hydroxy-phenyl)propionate hydroxylase